MAWHDPKNVFLNYFLLSSNAISIAPCAYTMESIRNSLARMVVYHTGVHTSSTYIKHVYRNKFFFIFFQCLFIRKLVDYLFLNIIVIILYN